MKKTSRIEDGVAITDYLSDRGAYLKKVPRIEVDTVLIPWAIARAALEDVCLWLDEPLPEQWIDALTYRMQTIYAHNPEFRRPVRGRGASGRDYLWAVTRHWLAAMIYDYRYDLGKRLPDSYTWGHPLPEKPGGLTMVTYPGGILRELQLRADSRTRQIRRSPRHRDRCSAPRRDQAWAAAAHFHA
jgi:hypothetical protein